MRYTLYRVGKKKDDCLDLNNSSGMLVALMPRTNDEAARLMEYLRGEEYGVGSVCYLEEPSSTTKYLGGPKTQHIPILEDVKMILPLQVEDYSSLRTIELGEASLEANESRGYLLHRKRIDVYKVDIVGAFCFGSFCDRQDVGDPGTKNCGCFSRNPGGHDRVFDMTVHFHGPFNGKMESVKNFRSYRTSKLFVRDMDTWDFLQQRKFEGLREFTQIRRDSVRQMVEYVNDHGGWTIAGWVRKGESRDASDVNNETYTSFDDSLHVTFLFPTTVSIKDTYEFKLLQLRVADGKLVGGKAETVDLTDQDDNKGEGEREKKGRRQR